MRIKVLVVDDSGFFRRQISKLINEDETLEVIDTAENGKDAVEKALRLKPDVITMDIEMPVMDGIAATREILRHCDIPILMFSSLTTEGAQLTLDAIDAGAVDYIPKRLEDISKNRKEVQKVLCDKIHQIGSHGRRRFSNEVLTKNPELKPEPSLHKKSTTPFDSTSSIVTSLKKSKYKLLAIGTSTGGPIALQTVLKKIPANFPLPIVLIQHMPATFTPAFATRLDQLCEITVKEACDGDKLKPGHAYLAPGGKQMTVTKMGGGYQLNVTNGDKNLTYKPSVDITFDSIAEVIPRNVLAIVLTGMGADGCKGAKKMKSSGATIWAQDEASSVVWGMPAAIVDAGIADKVLDLNDITDQILRVV